MLILLVLIGATNSLPLDSIALISSESTSQSLINAFSVFPTSLSYSSENRENLYSQLKSLDINLILDITFEPRIFIYLDNICEALQIPYLTLSITESITFSPWRFSVHNDHFIEGNTLNDLTHFLNWTEFTLLSSSNHLNLKIADTVYANSSIMTYLKYDENIEKSVSDNLIGKMIKAKGIKKLVIIDCENSLVTIQKSIQEKNILKPGFAVILGSKAIYSNNLEGSIILVEQGLELAISYENYEFLAVFNILNKIFAYNEKVQITTSAEILNILQKLPLKKTYSIINIQNSKKVNIGSISDHQVVLTSKIFYAGNATNLSDYQKASLQFSINNGTHETFNLYTFNTFAYYYQGATYAAARSNKNNDIPNFEISLYPVDCGIYLYNDTWFKLTLSKYIPNFGLALLSGLWYTVAYGDLLTLRSFGLNIPQISPVAQDSIVDNSTEFPNFLKLSVTVHEYWSNTLLFLSAMGWTDIVVIHTDDPTYTRQYRNLLANYLQLGLHIVNPEDQRTLPANYSRNSFNQYKSIFQTAKDTNCRIFFVLAINRGYVVEGLYDIGLRRGDFLMFTDSTVLAYLSGDSEEFLYKRQQLMYGSFLVSYKEFNGVLGKELKAEMSLLFPDLSYMCMSYDAISVLKSAINYILAKGDDYQDPKTLMTVMRNNRLVGCLGNVFFGQNSNSRTSAQFSVQQIRFNYTNNAWQGIDVAYLDDLSAQAITIASPMQWPLTNTTIPTNYRDINPCPFDQYLVVASNSGRGILYAISVFFVIISTIIAKISAKNHSGNFEILKQKEIISFADMVYLSYFFFQFLQILSMGPDQNSYKYLLNNFQVLISLDFNLFFQVTYEKFWILFYCVLSFSIVWIIFCLIIITKLNHFDERNFFMKFVQSMSTLFLPILGHIFFLPIFSMLMNIFLCYDGISNSLTDSYLFQDCTTYCYSGQHKTLAILSVICITFYLPCAIYCRPLWETTQNSLHLKTKSSYLSFLSVFQVVLVILNKTLKYYSQIVHGAVLSCIIFLFTVTTYKLRPYNYTRANTIQIFSLILSFWGVLTSTIFQFDLITWIVCEFIGFGVILIIGVIVVSHFPPFLTSEKGRSVSNLFLFQFCRKEENYITDPGSIRSQSMRPLDFSSS